MSAGRVDVRGVLSLAKRYATDKGALDAMVLDPCGLAQMIGEVDAAVAELSAALAAMTALAKGPAGGVTQTQKREVIARAEAALAATGAA